VSIDAIGDLLLASTDCRDGFRRSGEFPRFLGKFWIEYLSENPSARVSVAAEEGLWGFRTLLLT